MVESQGCGLKFGIKQCLFENYYITQFDDSEFNGTIYVLRKCPILVCVGSAILSTPTLEMSAK